MRDKIRKLIEKTNPHYPSAKMLQATCYEDYRRVIDTYDKIYEKTNIALGISGIILLAIISNCDYTIVIRIANTKNNLELFSLLVFIICSFASAVLIIWTVIQLMMLMRSRSITVFDSVSIRDVELYREKEENAAVWIIDKYTQAINELRPIIIKKQKILDSSITKIVVALLCYAVSIIIKKGL